MPLSAIVAGEFVALLMTVTLPVALPTTVGSNVTLKEVDWFAARVRGNVRPPTVKPVPVTASPERERLPLPELVRVTTLVVLLPVNKLPKLSEVGDAESWRACATPVPVTETAIDGVPELFASVSVPERIPDVVGAKLTAQDELAPGAIVRGRVRPE